MKARLLAKSGPLRGSSFEIGDEATLGRGADNGVVLPSDLVSRRHARIYFDVAEGQYFIEDLGSANGVRVAGVRVREPERLSPIELITIAEKLDFIFQVPVERTVAPAPRAAATAAVPVQPAETASPPGPPQGREADVILERTMLEPAVSLPPALAGGGSSERTLAEGSLALPAGWKGNAAGTGVDTAIVDGLPPPPDRLLRPGSVPADATVIESEPPEPPERPRSKRD